MPAYDPKSFAWHADAMKAKLDTTGEIQYPPIYNDTAMTGTYAFRPDKKKAPKAVFFWYSTTTGDLMCRVDNHPIKAGLDIWPGCSRFPISRAVYDAVIDGGQWPHEIQVQFEDGTVDSTLTAGPGHNSGDDEKDLAALKGNIAEWSERAKLAIRKGAPKNQVDADALSDIATKLREMLGEAEKRRLQVTDPLHKKWKDEVERWTSFIKPAQPYVTNLLGLVDVYLKAENKRRADEARAAQDAAAAEAAAKVQKAQAGEPIKSVEELIPPKVATPPPATAGTRKTVRSVTRKVVTFSDFKAAAAFFCGMEKVEPDIMAAISYNAHKLLSAGVPVPGASFEPETKAQ